MQKPASVTGIAYIQFLTIWSMVKMYDTPLVGKAPLYLGSWLSPHVQWAYCAIEVLITTLATMGLFLGHNWARWLLLVGALVGWVVAFPVRDMHGIPLYLISLLFGSILFYLLFLARSARVYFSLPRGKKASLSLRGFIGAVLYANCALSIYSFSLFAFTNRTPFGLPLALTGFLIVSLPCLLLGMAARWNFVTVFRDAATVLIATALFLTFQLLARTLLLSVMSPESLPLVDFKPAVFITVVVGVLVVVLARASVRRRLRQDRNMHEARSSFG